jgi:hypothetical protein
MLLIYFLYYCNMKKHIFILGSIIAIAILFYPQSTIGKLTGSPGGKTGSPMDNSDCTSCHNVAGTTVSTTDITSNIPSTGYIPGNIYTITGNLNSFDQTGFEITCEENTNNTKTGTFFNTNPSATQLVNNGNAITHTAAGNSSSTWSFDWEAPSIGTGGITFYGAFIAAGYPIGSNAGDYLTLSTLSISEYTLPSAIGEYAKDKELIKVSDFLGREANSKNQPLFYIYDDGTVEKKIILE